MDVSRSPRLLGRPGQLNKSRVPWERWQRLAVHEIWQHPIGCKRLQRIPYDSSEGEASHENTACDMLSQGIAPEITQNQLYPMGCSTTKVHPRVTRSFMRLLEISSLNTYSQEITCINSDFIIHYTHLLSSLTLDGSALHRCHLYSLSPCFHSL